MVWVQKPTDVMLVSDAGSTSIGAVSPSLADDHSIGGSQSMASAAPNVYSMQPALKLELTAATDTPFLSDAKLMPKPVSWENAGDAKGWDMSTRNHDKNATVPPDGFRFWTYVVGGIPSISPFVICSMPTMSF